jgi:hypothetical protein
MEKMEVDESAETEMENIKESEEKCSKNQGGKKAGKVNFKKFYLIILNAIFRIYHPEFGKIMNFIQSRPRMTDFTNIIWAKGSSAMRNGWHLQKR